MNKLISNQYNFICKYAEIEDKYISAKIQYGLQCIYSDGSKILLLFLIFLYLKSLDYFVIMILLLIPRTLIGGSHCKTYSKCLVSSLFFSLSTLLVSTTFNIHLMPLEIIILISLGYLTLKKELTQNPLRATQNKLILKQQRILALLIIYSFNIFSYLFLNDNLITFSFLISTFILCDFIFKKPSQSNN